MAQYARCSLALPPGLKADVDTLAHIKHQTFNKLVAEVLTRYVEGNADVISDYQKLTARLTPEPTA